LAKSKLTTGGFDDLTELALKYSTDLHPWLTPAIRVGIQLKNNFFNPNTNP